LVDGKKSPILRWIVFLPVLGVIMTTMLLVSIYIKYENDRYSRDIDEIKRKFLKETKIKARERIDTIASFLQSNESALKEEAKLEVKHLVLLAVEIMENIYYENKTLSKKQIIEKIKEKLRPIRFFENLSGYFFIYDLNGYNLLLPTQPYMENTYMYNHQDVKGTYIIQDFINIAKNTQEDFYEWFWYKPDALDSPMKKKIGYIRLFAPLGILVGTARYEEDVLDKVKKEAKVFLDEISYSDGAYIFAYDSDGNLITTKKEQQQFSQGSSEVNQIIRGSKISPEGFFISHTTSMQFDTNEAKRYNSSFVRYLENLDWVIGTNTYGASVLQEINLKEEELENQLYQSIVEILAVSFAIVVIVLFIMLDFSSRLRRILRYYESRLMLKHAKAIEQKKLLQYQVKHDTLTSLPNRILLTDRLEQLLKRAKREGYKVAVLFVDLDKFKHINDSYGHHLGDVLLKQVAKRLQSGVRESDIVGRLSGDEFIIVLDNCEDVHDVVKVLQKIKDGFQEEFILEEVRQSVKLSIGISMYPDDGVNVNELLKNADTAMLKAKEEGRDNYKFYTNKMNEEVEHQIKVERELREALFHNQFILHYQPIVSAKDGFIEGVEALIRWNHPEKGLVYPNYFIEIAEESNLIIEIGEWVSKEAMRQVFQWYSMGLNPGRVSINFAGRQLEQDGLYEFILETLKQTGCKPEWLGVEVIERYIMKNPKKSIELLKKLRAINIGISIDDFGTGYSSLSYLKQLPITKLKIDRVFVENLSKSFEDRAIAKTIMALGSGLYLKVLAEGVETELQRKFLLNHGCTQMQGFFFSKPVEAREIEVLLRKQKDALSI
jgi:diguanylate cyclase (GGDEF)-like protein